IVAKKDFVVGERGQRGGSESLQRGFRHGKPSGTESATCNFSTCGKGSVARSSSSAAAASSQIAGFGTFPAEIEVLHTVDSSVTPRLNDPLILRSLHNNSSTGIP